MKRKPCHFCGEPRDRSEKPLKARKDGNRYPCCVDCKEVRRYYRSWPDYLPKPDIDPDVIRNGRKAL